MGRAQGSQVAQESLAVSEGAWGVDVVDKLGRDNEPEGGIIAGPEEELDRVVEAPDGVGHERGRYGLLPNWG